MSDAYLLSRLKLSAKRSADTPTPEATMNDDNGIMYNRACAFFTGLAIGVAAMYLADPVTGGRRRALVRNKAKRAFHDSRDFLGRASRDLRHRAQGLAARRRSPQGPVGDDVLAERVRAKMGHYVSHPRAVEVSADQGCITLRGPILEAEMAPLLQALSRVPGVHEVDNQLEPHETADVPDLQGGVPRGGEPAEWQQRNWTPGVQLLTGVAIAGGLLTTLLRWRAGRGEYEEYVEYGDEHADVGGLGEVPRTEPTTP